MRVKVVTTECVKILHKLNIKAKKVFAKKNPDRAVSLGKTSGDLATINEC